MDIFEAWAAAAVIVVAIDVLRWHLAAARRRRAEADAQVLRTAPAGSPDADAQTDATPRRLADRRTTERRAS